MNKNELKGFGQIVFVMLLKRSDILPLTRYVTRKLAGNWELGVGYTKYFNIANPNPYPEPYNLTVYGLFN